MGCGSCGTGKPNGCKSNGGCSTGGCNRMNVHDWLMNLPFSDPESSCKIVEVSFGQGSRKEFYRNTTLQYFEKGELVTVEGVSGFDVGEVSLSGELVRMQLKKRGVKEDSPELKRIMRRSSQFDIEKWKESKSREKEALVRSRAAARQLGLQMKIAEVEFQADGKKATFFYTADDRVDFRELIRVFAGEFKVKVEMRQIGARQEAGKVGGIGSCGRELCCSTWLTDFKSVNTQAARYQNLSINQTKLSGQCGRLKCCLNFELDTYMDALQFFPENADDLMTTRGKAYLVKKDIFKNLMWYTLPDSSKQYPLTIKRVKEIKQQNAQGIAVEELQPVEIVSSKQIEKEPQFVELVGQISLRSLEKNSRKQKQQGRGGDRDRNRGGDQRGPSNRGGSQQEPRNPQGPGNRQPQRPQQQGQPRGDRGPQPQGGERQGRGPQQQGGGQPRPERGPQQAGGRPPRGPQAPRGQQPQRPAGNDRRPPQQSDRPPQQPRPPRGNDRPPKDAGPKAE